MGLAGTLESVKVTLDTVEQDARAVEVRNGARTARIEPHLAPCKLAIGSTGHTDRTCAEHGDGHIRQIFHINCHDKCSFLRKSTSMGASPTSRSIPDGLQTL